MAISNSKPYLVPLIFKALFLLLLLNKVQSQSESVRFTFPDFWSGLDKIALRGGANSTAGTLQLTKTNQNGVPAQTTAGQALYSEPLKIWDNATGRIASFYTEFTFFQKITGAGPADGLAFFLAPQDSNVKDAGGYLGLFTKATATQPSKNQVVAVEFDMWSNNNEFPEPPYKHIGIDVNSIVSVATTEWKDGDVFSGKKATARISYDGFSKILTVVLSYPDNGGEYILSHPVDLSANLPEWVRVGFSSATGNHQTLIDYVLSWNFSSTWKRTTSFGAAEKLEIIRSVV